MLTQWVDRAPPGWHSERVADVTDPGWTEQPLFDAGVSAPLTAPKPRRRAAKPEDPREFGGWSLDKLTILQKYLKMYRRVAGSGTYIDGFAGEGVAKIGGVIRPSSAQIALESGAFRQLFLVELNTTLASRLEARVAEHREANRCFVLPGDCNTVIVDQLLSGEVVDRSRPCFAFLDPDSTQLSWSTVDALARYKIHNPEQKACKIELWILFNEYQAIQRLWPRDKGRLPPFAETLDRVMGDRAAWLDLWEQGKSAAWLVGRYRDRLVELGYRRVHQQQIIDPSTGRPQYWMVHATDHDAAASFMKWAKRSSSISMHNEPLPGFAD